MAETKLELDMIAKAQDVSLAKEYLKAQNFEFRPSRRYSQNRTEHEPKIIKDNFGNTIYLSSTLEPHAYKLISRTPPKFKFEELYKKLSVNIELFAQLDFMLRNVPIDETKNINMKLILNEMQDFLLRVTDKPLLIKGSSFILLDDEAPTAVLGRAFLILKMGCYIEIVATPKTAPIASMFYQLCKAAGFPITLQIMEQDAIRISRYFKYIPRMEKGIRQGTVGVVTESADIDSAVDSFLAPSSKMPWRLCRVYVHETVYGLFKKTLLWKCCEEAPREGSRVGAEIKDMCANVFEAADKVFLIDYTGREPPAKEGVVLVRAYRMVEELQRDGLLEVWGQAAGDAAAGGAHVSLNDRLTSGALHRAFYCSFSAPRFEAYPREHAPWPDRRTLITFLDEHAHREADRTAATFKQMLLQFPERPDRVSVQDGGLSVVMTSPADVICAPYRGRFDLISVAKGFSLAFHSNSLFVVQIIGGKRDNSCKKLLKSLSEIQQNMPIFFDSSYTFIYGAPSWYKVKSLWIKF